MRLEYWARTQSSLKRLATKIVTLEKSSETWATRGLIQVLNCCSGSSWASWSTQACHRLSPAPRLALAARLLCCPSLIVWLSPLVDIFILRSGAILNYQNLIHKDVFGMMTLSLRALPMTLIDRYSGYVLAGH